MDSTKCPYFKGIYWGDHAPQPKHWGDHWPPGSPLSYTPMANSQSPCMEKLAESRPLTTFVIYSIAI